MHKDDLLILRIKKGDKEAFKTIYENYSSALLFHIVKLVNNREIAEEILSEVFITVINKIGFYKPNKTKGATFRAWIYRIATNRSIDYFRKVKREKIFEEESVREIGSSKKGFEEEFEIKDKLLKAEDLISKLPVSQKVVINLKVKESLSYMEISRVIGMSVDSVKQLLFRARKALKDEFELLEESV